MWSVTFSFFLNPLFKVYFTASKLILELSSNRSNFFVPYFLKENAFSTSCQE